jgi:hypothetical protein
MMNFGGGTITGLLALIVAIDLAQFGHQLVLAREVARNSARLEEDT